MLKLVIGMKSKAGFTLIEILVVLLIIGITLGFALLAFGDFGTKRRIIVAAEQLVNYIKFTQQVAILEASTLGIHLNSIGYEVMRFSPPNRWQPMSKKTVFHSQYFPSHTCIEIDTAMSQKTAPQIIINPSGEMTAFKLNIGSGQQAHIASVIGKENGRVTLEVLDSP